LPVHLSTQIQLTAMFRKDCVTIVTVSNPFSIHADSTSESEGIIKEIEKGTTLTGQVT